MKKSKLPPAPKKLSAEAAGLWDAIVNEFEFDAGALATLETTLQAFDRWREAQAILDKDGLTTKDRFGQVRAHPAVLIERDARTAYQRGMKMLGLDLPPAPEPAHRRFR